MYFNVSYDFISLCVLLVLTVHFFSLRKFPIFSNLMYGFLLILAVINLTLDILGSFAVKKISEIPVFLAYIPNVLYYVSELLLSAALVVYLIALIGNHTTVRKSYYLFSLIPFGICFAVFAVGMILGEVFTITESGQYEYGSLSFITYACAGIYLSLMFLILITQRRYFGKRDRCSISILGGLVILSSVLQMINPRELLSGSAIAVSLLIMFFSIQDPQMMLDPDTGR